MRKKIEENNKKYYAFLSIVSAFIFGFILGLVIIMLIRSFMFNIKVSTNFLITSLTTIDVVVGILIGIIGAILMYKLILYVKYVNKEKKMLELTGGGTLK